MRARWLLVAGLALLGAGSPLWAGPFAEVPEGHEAYRMCTRLASLGMLSEGRSGAFSGSPAITRFEFGIALLEPLTAVDRALATVPSDADGQTRLRAVLRSLRVRPRNSEEEIAGALSDLRRLAQEFADVLESMGFDSDRVSQSLRELADKDAIRTWRLESLAYPGQGPAPAGRTSAFVSAGTVHLPLAHGIVGLSLTSPDEAPELLDHLAKSAAAEHFAGGSAGGAEAAVADPRISRLRTTYEYGLGSALTLSLAYEEIARRGQGLSDLDAASLTSLGIGYQITPSASVKLSYSLLEYSNYVLETPLLRDRVAETAVSIEF